MKILAAPTIQLILYLIIGNLLCSCHKECGPIKDPYLTEKEKEFIQNQTGDTLHFKDSSGKEYFLVCKAKELTQSSYTYFGNNTGPKDPCDNTDVQWDKLTANFEGNILNDQNQPVSLQIEIEGNNNPYGPPSYGPPNQCETNHKCSFYLKFKVTSPSEIQQIYKGKTDENLYPVIINFGFISDLILGGQQFNKLNTIGISNYSCLYSRDSTAVGIDSVYYSTVLGLVRLTTYGGIKYQRVL